MFKKLNDAYDSLVAAVQDYAASWRAASQRVRDLHGLDAPTLLPPVLPAPGPVAAETRVAPRKGR